MPDQTSSKPPGKRDDPVRGSCVFTMSCAPSNRGGIAASIVASARIRSPKYVPLFMSMVRNLE